MPIGVTTVTSMGPPAEAEGEVALTWVAETAVMLPTAEPNMTALAPMNPVPVMVTAVPPPSGPATGLTVLTEGRAS